jgi:hypothetical protein
VALQASRKILDLTTEKEMWRLQMGRSSEELRDLEARGHDDQTLLNALHYINVQLNERNTRSHTTHTSSNASSGEDNTIFSDEDVLDLTIEADDASTPFARSSSSSSSSSLSSSSLSSSSSSLSSSSFSSSSSSSSSSYSASLAQPQPSMLEGIRCQAPSDIIELGLFLALFLCSSCVAPFSSWLCTSVFDVS